MRFGGVRPRGLRQIVCSHYASVRSVARHYRELAPLHGVQSSEDARYPSHPCERGAGPLNVLHARIALDEMQSRCAPCSAPGAVKYPHEIRSNTKLEVRHVQ